MASVLIVEDEPVVRNTLTRLLSKRGYDTISVDSGEAALHCLAAVNDVNVALIDVDLPGINGFELVRRLEVDQPQITPVLLSGADRDRLELFGDQHSIKIMRKPINFKCLIDVINDPKKS